MKKSVKFLSLTLALALVAALSIGGTLAYLSAKDDVVNTFEIGKIEMTLDEAKTNIHGQIVDADNNVIEELVKAPRVKSNHYKLVPGAKMHKDPTVHVKAGSEASIVYITINNELAAAVPNDYILAQVTNPKLGNWKPVIDEDNNPVMDSNGNPVFYQTVPATTTEVHLPVFTGFIVDMDADEQILNRLTDSTITVNAYAVQSDNWMYDLGGGILRPVSEADLPAYVWSQTFGK